MRPGLVVAAVGLAMMVLPQTFLLFLSLFNDIKSRYYEDALLLGFYPRQILVQILLRTLGYRKFIGSIALSFSRLCGDTAIVMLTGAAVDVGIPRGLSSPFETLSFQIFYLATEGRTQLDDARLIAASLLLVTLTSLTSVTSRWLGVGKGLRSGVEYR